MKKRVLMAMSGGVDSSYAAYLLKEKGYEVIGVTMRLWPKEFCDRVDKKSCCSYLGVASARQVASQLGIRFYVVNLAGEFKREVIDYFISEYLSGRTPNPCIKCNEKIKFGALLRKADQLNCRFIATGHYARIEKARISGVWELKKGKDKKKDQSYVLFSLSQNVLSRTLLPLGNYRKQDVLRNIKRAGLKVAQEAESQDICFVPENNYRLFLKGKVRPQRPGEIVASSGRVLGEHQGTYLFTVGQRRGLSVALGRRQYVTRIDVPSRRVVVGDEKELLKKRLTARRVSWIDKKSVKFPLKARAQIRYNHNPAEALVKRAGQGRVRVEFKRAQSAITPGQAVVFYKRDLVLGGGWIEKAGN